MMKKFLVTLLLCYSVTLSLVKASPCDEFGVSQDKIDCLQKEKDKYSSQAQTLAGQIAYYDNQIKLAQLKISQSEEQIASVSARIIQLEEKLRDKSNLLEKQIIQTYKQGVFDPLQILFGSQNVNDLISQVKYLQIVQAQNRKYLHDTQLVQTSYSKQKDLIEDAKKRLQVQKTVLDSYSKERASLLVQTKNNEATYQRLLVLAKQELDSLKAFTQYRGGGILPAQSSPDGWYFNQRDERWGKLCIGSTCGRNPEYVWEVGCLITDVAMVKKKNGQNVTPTTIAQDLSYFWPSTAYMLHSALNSHGFSVYGGNRLDLINSELEKGRLVIIHMTVHTNDGHYVVLKSKNGNDYIMNDPWEGPDLIFSKYYTTSSINQVITYSP